ncbi:MAG: nucleoside deaminase [Fretibacterium sp.]|nr:nucleoside deaminase [Fretibacterium sp.]
MDLRHVNRFLDVIERDIAPLTKKGVAMGSKVFGAAVLRASDLSLVLAETNHEAMSPLWHGEMWTIKMFYELQDRPAAEECVFLSTHQPCCLCASALAWAGFRKVVYLFGYESTEEDFNIPHDRRMIRELFNCEAPRPDNAYFSWCSLGDAVAVLSNDAPERCRLDSIVRLYAQLSDTYQRGEKLMVLK